MKKELLKTIILTLLIFSSVILSVQIWLLNPVWSENLNPLTALNNIFKNDEEGLSIKDTGAFNSVFSPRSFVFTYNDGRLIFNTTKPEGQSVRNCFNSVIKEAFNVTNATKISEEEWQIALKSNSIYADYSVQISSVAFSSFLDNISKPVLPITSFNQVVVALNGAASSNYICFRNSEENTQVKVPLTDTTELSEIYQRYKTEQKASYSYAFELNLDKKVDSLAVQQTVLIDSYVLIPVEPVRMNTISSKKIEFSEDNIESILEIFGYNLKSLRKYTDSNGENLYIDSIATLKLNPKEGTIEYIATEGRGLALQGDNSLSSIVSACGVILDNIYNLFETDPNVTLFINSPLNDDTATNYTITFDYLFNGNIIQSKEHSCEIRITDGKISEFRANIKDYSYVKDGEEENALEILDILYSNLNQDTIVINNLYNGYVDSRMDMPLRWQAKIQGSDEIITVK